MRLTKLEKLVHDCIADGHDHQTIASLLKLETSKLFEVLVSINAKYQESDLKEARKKDTIMRNEILAPQIHGLKCQNLDKEKPKYWFYTGFEKDVMTAHQQFLELGISTTIRKHGNNGKFWLLVDNWVTGKLLPVVDQEINKNLGSEGENHVNDSFRKTTNTATDCFETGFEYFGTIQSQDIECTT